MKVRLDDPAIRVRGAPGLRQSAARLAAYRPIEDDDGLNFDSPGTCVEFASAASELRLEVAYTARHKRTDALNGVGVITVDGKVSATFGPPASRPGTATAVLHLPATPTPRVFGLHLPYGDSVELTALTLGQGSALAPLPDRSMRPRWLAFGDSITQGYHATTALASYPGLVGHARNWDVFNFGMGGRGIRRRDGAALAAFPAELISVLLGYNDFAHQHALAECARELAEMLLTVRRGQPDVPLVVITPLWSSGRPMTREIHPLSAYRTAITDAVQSLSDPLLSLIDGTGLIPADPRFFADGIHPNDAGFTRLASSLAPLLPTPSARTSDPA